MVHGDSWLTKSAGLKLLSKIYKENFEYHSLEETYPRNPRRLACVVDPSARVEIACTQKKRPRRSESNIEVPRFRNRGLQEVFRYTRSPLAKRPRYNKFNIEVSRLVRGPNWASLISDVLSEGTALVWSALESHPHSAYVSPTDCPRKPTLKLSYILCGFPRVLCPPAIFENSCVGHDLTHVRS